MNNNRRLDLAHDLILPTLLFTVLGGMTWAVRGCSGFGASAGCLFAGVTWGAAWWFIAHDPSREQSRRYASGWIILAMTLGVGLSGARGWMQWPSFFRGELQTDTDHHEFVPIPRAYGFLWLFIAGMPWGGIGACLLAWTGSLRTTRWWHWAIRLACGIGMAHFARCVFDSHHAWFLPLYDSLGTRYEAAALEGPDPNLQRLINDNGAALVHLGLYLGLFLYELGCTLYRVGRKELADWKNPLLILTVGVISGAGWALCQNWQWATDVFGKDARFNFWRCWESSGGLSIGIAYGIAYFLVNRRMSDRERALAASRQSIEGPTFEWLLVFLGLAYYAYIAPLTVSVTRGQMEGQFPPFLSTVSALLPGQWATLYFAVVLLFGGIYYCVYRPMKSEAVSKNGGSSSLGDSIVAAMLTLVLTASLFVPDYRFVRGAQTIHLADAALWFNRFIRHVKHVPAVGSFVQSFQIEQFAPVYIELFAGIVLALGLVWYLLNRRRLEGEVQTEAQIGGDPNLERFGLYLGLLMGLGLSIRNGLKGWFNIYCVKDDQYWTKFFSQHFHARGNEVYWSRILWYYFGPASLVLLVALVLWILCAPLPRRFRGNLFPHAYGVMWLVLIVQNAIAQLVTGPPDSWYEMAFSIYYALLFAISAVIVLHFHTLKVVQSVNPAVGGYSSPSRFSAEESRALEERPGRRGRG